MIELLGCGGLRYCRGSGRVYRVAVGGGACGEYIPQAIAQGCDTFVTSDLRYNDFLDTRGLNLQKLCQCSQRFTPKQNSRFLSF